MPASKLVNGVHFDNLRGDIYGGLTAAAVALPLALAMAIAGIVRPSCWIRQMSPEQRVEKKDECAQRRGGD